MKGEFAMDQFELYLQYQKELAVSKLKVIEQFQKGGRTKSRKRTSKIEIASRSSNPSARKSNTFILFTRISDSSEMI